MKNKDMEEGTPPYIEQYAGALVTNSSLRLALLCCSVALVGTLVLASMMYSWTRNQKPIVIRIDPEGRASVNGVFTPEAPELRYFLAQFVSLHFSRLVGSVEERTAKSLYYLDRRLGQAFIDEEGRTKAISKFSHEGAEEIDIDIKNIALQDLRSRPMRASVDFEKVYYNRGDRRESRREHYTGSFEFVVQENVPNNFILVNPLGLTITYFRVDEAFK